MDHSNHMDDMISSLAMDHSMPGMDHGDMDMCSMNVRSYLRFQKNHLLTII